MTHSSPSLRSADPALRGPVRLLWTRPERPLRAIAIGIKAWTLDRPMTLAAIVVPLVLMPLLLAGFGVFKMLFPHYDPVRWDDAFAAPDRTLFLGQVRKGVLYGQSVLLRVEIVRCTTI